MEILKKLALAIFSKKRLIGWGSALAFLAGAAALSMDQKEFKDAVCGAPTISADIPGEQTK